ncbi:MAG: penicillin-binding protein 2 [Candidatus Doudnabacteria bacterium]|nr:penicillin-binding protein 2 [Candidatus Doudnabacteria bacterium]
MKDPFAVTTNLSSRSKKELDWDESAMDSQVEIEDVHDSERVSGNFFFARFFLILMLFLLGGRLFYLQVVRGGYFQEMAENNRIRSQVIRAPRGLILDRFSKPLLENIAGFNLVTVPFDLPKIGTEDQMRKLSRLLNLDYADISKKIEAMDKKSITPQVIAQDLSLESSILFQTHASEFAGFSVEKTPIRHYFQPEKFSALVGYTGLADEKDLYKFNLSDVEAGSQVGKQGLEVFYENFLRGVSGENQVEVDSSGKILNVLGEKASQPGNSLSLNIDADLQTEIYNNFTQNGTVPVRGAVIALNPKTGEVLALLSLPGFDNNLFSHGISQQDYQKLANDPKKPFLNRAISGQYPPGSTVKPVVAAAALNEGLVNEDTVIVDKGLLVIPNQYDSNVSYNFVGWKLTGLGPMNVKSAIAQSSDIYFYIVSGGHPSSKIEGLGILKLADYYRKFNVGKVTGIDLPGEKAGVVADPAWKAKAFANDAIMKKWYLGDTYHVGIGQGDMLTTPLQVAFWTSIFANNGVGMKPKILNSVKSSDGSEILQNKPEILVEKFLPDSILKTVQEGMRETIISGSGRQLLSLPITSAGKTGTSQFDGSDPKKTHAWFTAYAPYEDPQIVITVLVEAGGEGHAAAVPVAKHALEWWAKNRLNK